MAKYPGKLKHRTDGQITATRPRTDIQLGFMCGASLLGAELSAEREHAGPQVPDSGVRCRTAGGPPQASYHVPPLPLNATLPAGLQNIATELGYYVNEEALSDGRTKC